MTGLDDRQIARWRLASQHLVGRPAGAPDDVVRGLLAVQAENFSQAGWAVAARGTRIDWARFTAAFDAGDLLRTHVLRTTWHFVTPDDLVWLVGLTAPALRRLYDQSRRAYGIDDRTLDAAVAVIVDGIAADGPQTRAQLRARLQDADLPAAGPALTAVTAGAEVMALICSGPLAGADQTHALVRERAPRARRLDRDEALAEIALRYVTGHGPATERDLAYWATLTVTDVRRGLSAVADRLAVSSTTDGPSGTPSTRNRPTGPRGSCVGYGGAPTGGSGGYAGTYCQRMLVCVRTSMNLPDGLLAAAKRRAEAEGTTVTSLVERALRDLLARPPARPSVESLPTYDAPQSRLLVDLADRDALYAALDADGAK
jgi:hypothetical protein